MRNNKFNFLSKNFLLKVGNLFFIGLMIRFLASLFINTDILMDIIDNMMLICYGNYLYLEFNSYKSFHIIKNSKDISSPNHQIFLFKRNNNNPINILKESVRSSQTINTDLALLDKAKRRIYWSFIGGVKKDHYGSFENFKPHWNSDLSVKEGIKNWYNLQTGVIKWLVNRRRPNQ